MGFMCSTGHCLSGDLYNPDYGSNPVSLKVVRRTSPSLQRKNLCRTQTSPLVERRHIEKHPRPVTSPLQITNLEKINFEVNPDTDSPAQLLLSKSATNFPGAEKPPVQRYNSLSPTFGRKKILDKLSPQSLRKSVILRSSSRKSDGMVDSGGFERCSGCGFPVLDDRVSITGKGGNRRLYHAECFKCSV